MAPDIEPTEASVEEISGGEQDQATPEAASGGNPAWESLRKELDPISFSRIEPHLKSMDTAGQQRFTKLNEEFKWAKDLQDQKITPDRVTAALKFAENLDASPETVYQQLGQFLQENGRMPSKQELSEAVAPESVDPESPQEDPRFQQLSEQNARIEKFLSDQEQERQVAAAEKQITGELAQLEATRTDLSRPDIGEILRYAADQNESIAKATQWFDSMKNRFLSAPRPGDSAPQLLPTSGGVPQSGQQKSPSQMTSAEIQALVAGGLQSSRG